MKIFNNSSSIHSLNADKELPKFKRKLWYFLNQINNAFFPNAKNTSLLIKPFSVSVDSADWDKLETGQSPSRTLSDLFWLNLPWKVIKDELGSINILDSGCGNGKYGLILDRYSKGRINQYSGIDIEEHPDWKQLASRYSHFDFNVAQSNNILAHIPKGTNFFISQSAIEHFEKDLAFFKHIQSFIARQEKPILQIHLFPSAACLKLYQHHGIRQYTPRTASIITRVFNKSKAELYCLGGSNSNATHWEFITDPIYFKKVGDLRNSQPNQYRAHLRESILNDMQSKAINEPSFYALVIRSHAKSRSLFRSNFLT